VLEVSRNKVKYLFNDMEFTTMFSRNGKELTVLNNFKFKFKYESKISGNQTWECTKKNMQEKIGFHKVKTLKLY
jgi:hypothetical protein